MARHIGCGVAAVIVCGCRGTELWAAISAMVWLPWHRAMARHIGYGLAAVALCGCHGPIPSEGSVRVFMAAVFFDGHCGRCCQGCGPPLTGAARWWPGMAQYSTFVYFLRINTLQVQGTCRKRRQ